MLNNFPTNIIQVESVEQVNIVRSLFIEYSEELGFELDFQDFNKELEQLPGKYSAPDGLLLLAYYYDSIAGCVGLCRFEQDICEMKRLYIKPEFRGKGIGIKLSEAVIYEAKKIGYDKMRLDTISYMKEAIGIYRKLGFYEIRKYRHNPFSDAVFMELVL
ncbi:MAG: hypothetical protein A2X61_09155 [Ignavibacteria bacterium GWB2_35_12]|nr:MAG: hypothetical protein A2X63_09955 [Ignavibacteria bacterium GWA2_35_8]OGU39379.1 MAG: hypothetical protein A2X61_09155 [Ignavibacteria bacterium GWB2_35_12]OGU92273.1 MAG: hypothetical protein A2220_05495 [Ignavibacteria bacterium RIFOXYA2_FULL_35_10]OGV21081.1 MAG: hypothetical protein A2475_00660 [Ignavibacteria bacterium RIFOXYC2_FULL_35_21]